MPQVTDVTDRTAAFNAALIVFACALLAARSGEWLERAASKSSDLRHKGDMIGRAAEALEGMYNNNGRGAKCALCLRQLEALVGHLGK